jgi:hypothetical protein
MQKVGKKQTLWTRRLELAYKTIIQQRAVADSESSMVQLQVSAEWQTLPAALVLRPSLPVLLALMARSAGASALARRKRRHRRVVN